MRFFFLDAYLGPVDMCLAFKFTVVFLFIPSVYFITELNRTYKEVTEVYSFKYIGESTIFSLSFAEIKILGGLVITIVGAILNIKPSLT